MASNPSPHGNRELGISRGLARPGVALGCLAYPARTRDMVPLALLAMAALCWTSSPAWAARDSKPPALLVTRVGQAHDLAADVAPKARLHLVGTVTYYDSGDGIMFLQDATGGIYVNTNKTYPVQSGDLVELDGQASPSYRTEIAVDPVIRKIGRSGGFAAPHYDYRDLVEGRGDCELVTIRGKVRAADIEQHAGVSKPSVHLDITMAEGEVQVYVNSTSFHPESLVDATVEVTAVAGGAFDAKNQLTGVILYAPEPSSIQVLERPNVSARQLPLTSINEVFQSRRIVDNSRPIRVRGTITYYKKGDSVFLENKGSSIYVQTRGNGDFAVGDVVDAIGFASDREYAPSLRQASLIKTGVKEEIAPRAVNYAEATSGKYSDNLISIDGVLVSQLHDADSYTVVLNAGGHLVSGYLEQKVADKDLALGSKVRISGICRIVPGGAWRAPYLSHLEMRSAGDVQLISEPPWWTVGHLLESLALLGAAAFGIAVWAVVLRRRVVHQTAWIDRSMFVARERSRILELISSNRASDQVLTEICESVARLLPNVACSHDLELDSDTSIRKNVNQPLILERVLFEVALIGEAEERVGSIVVSSAKDYLLPDDHEEVFAVLSELANLTMQQWLLYRGLVHHSTHDPLTELPNRRLCESRLASSLREAELQDGRMAVIYIDINHFKHVNDKYGHKTGDLYLQQISARLSAQIRSIDMLARVGGDEFVVIAPFAEGVDRSEALTVRLRACFDDPFSLDGQIITGSASFGLARFPENGKTIEELTRNADHAMYLSKQSERRTEEEAHGIAIITTDELEVALLRNQFRLAYQPQFSAEGQLTGLEALIRLEDPVLGLLTPDAFISVAERHSVIIDIGAWALNSVLKDASRWHLDTGDHLSIAVNVSVRQLEEPGYAESVLRCLREFKFPAERLELELIERSLMFSGEIVMRQLEQLRNAGVRISLDDFGTGQSCLSLLHRFPVDTIKLDRSFIRAMDDDPRVLPVIQAIVSMAHSLGKRVVAEAIEHVGPVPMLLAMGKMDFQGYLLGRPMPAESVDDFLPRWRAGIEMPDAFHDHMSPRAMRRF